MDTNITKLNISDMAVFKNSPNLLYIYKKTERLVSALYLLTSFISDSDPVKWQVREAGLKLLNQTLSVSDKPIQGVYLITLLLSYLEAAFLGGIISAMNHNILRAEFESLLKIIDAEEQAKLKGAIFPEHFLTVSESYTTEANSKGQHTMSDRISRPLTSPKPIRQPGPNRQESILALLRKQGGELGIKDFTKAISDCSEKTIQRELAVLVTKGLVLKKGEKRWSRYLLKS